MRQLRLRLQTLLAALGLAALGGPTTGQAAEIPEEVTRLTRAPNLAPTLTETEVAKLFQPWTAQLMEKAKGFSAEQTKEVVRMFRSATAALGPEVPKVKAITFYSLIPYEASELRNFYPVERVAELEKLPRFHDYPILGSVTFNDEGEASRWADFMRDQIWAGPDFACDYEPRHGFRFTRELKEVDMLMCFTCSQLARPDGRKIETKDNPVFSPAVRDVVNALFDKRGIERDQPKRGE